MSRLVVLPLFLVALSGCRSLTSLYFHPHQTYYNDPADFGIKYQEVQLSTEDGETLHNWLFEAEQPLKGRVVFFHGNAENISTHFASVYWLPSYGYEVLLVDYRGFGKSTGIPKLPQVLNDMVQSYRWMLSQNQETNVPVYVLGQSIGAALSTMAISELDHQPDCMVLDSGFASFKDMAKIGFQHSWLLWPFAYPASWLLPTEYEPQNYGDKLTSKVLQIHSIEDSVVPVEQGRLLNKTFQRVEWYETQGPHISTFNHQQHRDKVVEFFDACSD